MTNSRITLDPIKRGGRPCIRNLRISVYDVLDMLAEGMKIRTAGGPGVAITTPPAAGAK